MTVVVEAILNRLRENDSPELTLKALVAFGIVGERTCSCPAPRLLDIGKARRCCYECYGWEPEE